jgi:ribosomal protein S12 methylthiotransferase accessory factor
LNPQIAISRAFSELSQAEASGEVWDRNGENQLPRHANDDDLKQWLKNATLENQPHLIPDDTNAREVSDFPRLDGNDLLDDVNTCVEIARRNHLEVIVLDLTRQDVGFPVVRVTVPGLRNFWARFGPGRLYDVPARLGWIPCRLDESQLNPIPYFF